MDARKISGASFLDILFEGRNKDYGAYYLRKTYSRRLTTALLIMFASAVVAGGLIALSTDLPPSIPPLVIRDSIVLRHYSDDKKPEEALPETVDNPRTPVDQTRYNEPVILPDNLVGRADILPTMEEIGETIISTVTVDYGQNGLPLSTTLTGTALGIMERRVEDPDSIHMSVEIQASFDGDWLKFLRRNLDAMVPADYGAPPGDYRVIIQFVVDEDGGMSNVTALTRHGYGMEKEAMRVLNRSPKWKPAQQNGRAVKAYRRQPIVFRVL